MMDGDSWQCFDVLLIQLQSNRIFLDAIDLAQRYGDIFLSPQMTFAQHQVRDGIINPTPLYYFPRQRQQQSHA